MEIRAVDGVNSPTTGMVPVSRPNARAYHGIVCSPPCFVRTPARNGCSGRVVREADAGAPREPHRTFASVERTAGSEPSLIARMLGYSRNTPGRASELLDAFGLTSSRPQVKKYSGGLGAGSPSREHRRNAGLNPDERHRPGPRAAPVGTSRAWSRAARDGDLNTPVSRRGRPVVKESPHDSGKVIAEGTPGELTPRSVRGGLARRCAS